MAPKTAKRLLLLEDNPGDVRLIEQLLDEPDSASWDLVHRSSLSQGLIRTELEHFDVALIDLNLPDSRGLDTARRLLESAPDLAVVVLTGMTDEALGRQALAIGAQDYLSKDEISPAVLNRALRYAMERKELIKRLNASRERERQAQERGALARLSSRHGLDDAELAPLMRDYGRLAMAYVQAVRNREPRPSHRLQGFAERLAGLALTARDVLRLHLLMLEQVEAQLEHDTKGRQALAQDVRLALLELMGCLADSYRHRACHDGDKQ